MADLIDRQTAIDALDKQFWRSLNIPICKEIRNVAKETIKTLPSAQPERWIPVTERLPEDGQRVIVTYDLVRCYPWVNILRYGKPMFEDKPCFYEADSEWGDVPYDGIVAWMPLPEPYREEKANGKD